MPIGILGKKVGMTQIFDKEGKRVPITVISVPPSTIIGIKTKEKHGYNAIQVGSWPLLANKEKLLKKSIIFFFKNKKFPIFKHIKEYKVNLLDSYKEGDIIDLTLFAINEKIKISGKSTGIGTTGNIKRHHFKRGPMSHGSKHHRLQGSLGAGTSPGRVFPGKKMAGRSGNINVTFTGLKIMDIDHENNLLAIKGSTPGKFGNLINIQKI